jgi:hypothetical protein|nr:MAG TPA: hypothetical protein [Caudoviricetes sp.]
MLPCAYLRACSIVCKGILFIIVEYRNVEELRMF